jgi:hypothetical protein
MPTADLHCSLTSSPEVKLIQSKFSGIKNIVLRQNIQGLRDYCLGIKGQFFLWNVQGLSSTLQAY